MPIVFLVLFVAWIAVVAIAGAAVQLRRTGRIARRVRDARGSAQWWSRRIATFGVVLGVVAPIADLAGLPRLAFLDGPMAVVAGIGLVLLGLVVSIGSQVALGASWRADVDPGARTELVTSGPFAIVRNPILTGTEVSAIGLVLVLPNVITIAMVAAILAAHQVQVRLVEEPYLLATHGDAYRAYAARTGRFVPFLGRLS